MGLEDFKSERSNGYKKYGHHEYNDRLEEWKDEMQEEFPIELDIEFVEVSPEMTKHNGMAYRRDKDTYYIRISENYIERNSKKKVRLTLLHEMVHVYFYQRGYGDTNHDKYFRWVVGRVGASMTNMTIDSTKWKHCIEPFLQAEDD